MKHEQQQGHVQVPGQEKEPELELELELEQATGVQEKFLPSFCFTAVRVLFIGRGG